MCICVRKRAVPFSAYVSPWRSSQMLGLVCMAALCGGYLYFMSRFTPAEAGGRSGFRRVGRDGGSASAIIASSVRGLTSNPAYPYFIHRPGCAVRLQGGHYLSAKNGYQMDGRSAELTAQGFAAPVQNVTQHGGGGGPSEAFRTGPGSDRLLLASHNRLLWYHYNTGKVDVLHEGQV